MSDAPPPAAIEPIPATAVEDDLQLRPARRRLVAGLVAVLVVAAAVVMLVVVDPLSGAMIAFSLGAPGGGDGVGGGGTAAGASFDGGSSQASEQTNSQGVATSATFRANDIAGGFTASAATTHATEPATFTRHNMAAKPATIARVGSAHRDAAVNTSYAGRLQVKVRNGDGRPAADETVTLALGSRGRRRGRT